MDLVLKPEGFVFSGPGGLEAKRSVQGVEVCGCRV